MKVTIRAGKADDFATLAALHTASWKEHYRGICPDSYLDNEVEADRLNEWRKRMNSGNPDQQVFMAYDSDGQCCGFVCTYLRHHKEWGAYLDNLHVASTHHRKGIGLELMRAAANGIRQVDPSSKLYLHVLVENILAIRFYKKIGGRKIATYEVELPWGARGKVSDYLWSLDQLK